MHQDTASVVIPTRDRGALLQRALEPLLRDPAAAQIVMVDDGSTDCTSERLRTIASSYPGRIDLVHTPGVGPAYARQAGLEIVRHPIVLFMEDDLVASERLVGGHVEHHREHERLVVAGYSPIVPPREAPGRLIASLYAEEYERECARWEAGEAEVLGGLYGGHVSLRTNCALEVGLFNPEFEEHFHEDRDFGLRCVGAGLHGHFDRVLLAWHHYERNIESFERAAERLGSGMVRISRLHGDIVGEFDPASLWSAMPAPAGLVVRLSRRPRVRSMVRAALHAYLRWMPDRLDTRGQIATLRLLRRIGQVEGASRAMRQVALSQGSMGARQDASPGAS